MNVFGFEAPAWIIAVFLSLLMLLFSYLGWRNGRLQSLSSKPNATLISDAVLGLFGLLLGFTFSMSLDKHDQRRLMMVNDSNCIGDFASAAAMLKQPFQGNILQAVRNYVEVLLTPLANATDEKLIRARLDELQGMQGKIQDMVRDAIQEGTPMTVSLMATFNGMTSSHASRLASLRDRLPWNIMLLLCTAAIITMFLQGQRLGESGNNLSSSSVCLVLLVSMVVWVIVDLNQPQKGLIVVSSEPLERVLAGLRK